MILYKQIDLIALHEREGRSYWSRAADSMPEQNSSKQWHINIEQNAKANSADGFGKSSHSGCKYVSENTTQNLEICKAKKEISE